MIEVNFAIGQSTAAARSAPGRLVFSALAGVLLFSTQSAVAVPSFARQTGISCEACHTVFPELNHFGRMFKANGYLQTSLPQVRGETTTKEERLGLALICVPKVPVGNAENYRVRSL